LCTDLTPIVDAVVTAEADAFVAVGDRFDDDLRYLTRFAGTDRPAALVIVKTDDAAGRAVFCVAPSVRARAEKEFVEANGGDDEDGEFHDGVAREVRTVQASEHAGERAAAVVRDLLGDTGRAGGESSDRSVLVPASVPHDAAVYLDRAGSALASTDAVETARARKDAAETARLRRVQRAACAGMARAETVLAGGTVCDPAAPDADSEDQRPALRWEDGPLTAERLRREVNATLGAHGVTDAENSVVTPGNAPAERRPSGDEAIRAGETVVVSVSPRGADGYYGDLTRTFVVDGDGGWERRAFVAVESAHEAAIAEIEPGVPGKTVRGEASAELAAYGFDPNADADGLAFGRGTGHGVGVSRRESPALSGAGTLRSGNVVTVGAEVSDPSAGGVRLTDLVVVTDDGCEVLATYPSGIVPGNRE
jgi:Xaa-Pro aminopeptidase